MALTINNRYVFSVGPLNIEVVDATTDTDGTAAQDTFVSNLSRVEGGIANSRDTTNDSVQTASIYVDGSSPNVTLVPNLTANSNLKKVTLILFGY